MWWSRRSQEPANEHPSAKPVRTSSLADLGDECEAFLNGRYAAWLAERRRPIQAWAWLNLVAHGDAEELGAVAGGDNPLVPGEWRVPLSVLARRATEDAQREVLTPLELELMQVELVPDLSPRQLGLIAEYALDEWAAGSVTGA